MTAYPPKIYSDLGFGLFISFSLTSSVVASVDLLYRQWRCFFESQLVSMFLLWSAALRAQSDAQLMPAVPWRVKRPRK